MRFAQSIPTPIGFTARVCISEGAYIDEAALLYDLDDVIAAHNAKTFLAAMRPVTEEVGADGYDEQVAHGREILRYLRSSTREL